MSTKKQGSMQGYSHFNPHAGQGGNSPLYRFLFCSVTGNQQDGGVSYSMLQGTTNLQATQPPAPGSTFVQPPNPPNVRAYGVSNTQPAQSLPPSQGPTPTSTPPAPPIDTNSIKQMPFVINNARSNTASYAAAYQSPVFANFGPHGNNRNRMIAPGYFMQQGAYFQTPPMYPMAQQNMTNGQIIHSFTYPPANPVPALRPAGSGPRTTTPSITSPSPANSWPMPQPQQVQNIIPVPLPAQWPQQSTSSRPTKKERKNAIPIIDPETSKEVSAYDDTNTDAVKSPNDTDSPKEIDVDTAMQTKADFAERVSRLATEPPSFEPGMHSHPMMQKELSHGLHNGSDTFDLYANEWKSNAVIRDNCEGLDSSPQIATSIIMSIPSEPEHKPTPVVSANINSPPVRLQFSAHREYTSTEPPISTNSQLSAPNIVPPRIDNDDNVYGTSSAQPIISDTLISTTFSSNVTSVTTADVANKDSIPVVQPSVLVEEVPHQKIVNILQKPHPVVVPLTVHQPITPPSTLNICKKEDVLAQPVAPVAPTPVPSITSFPTCLPPIPPTQTTMQQPPFPQPFPSKSASLISKSKPQSVEQSVPQRSNDKSQTKDKKEKSRQKEIPPSSVDVQPLNTKVKGGPGNHTHTKPTDNNKGASGLSKQINGENTSDSSSTTEGKSGRKNKNAKGKKEKDAGNKKSLEKESAENTMEAYCDIKQTQNANSNTRSLNNNNNNVNSSNNNNNNNNSNNNNSNNNNNNNKISKTNSSQKTVERIQKPLEEDILITAKNEENIRKTGEIKTAVPTKSIEPKKSKDKENVKLLQINNYENNEKVTSKSIQGQSFVHSDIGQIITQIRRKYDLDTLKDINKNPECHKKLQYPEVEIASSLFILRDQQNPISSRNSASHSSNNILYPSFGGNTGPRNSAPITARKSQQGSLKRDNKPHNAPLIHMSLSLREEVQLRQSKNAWKPARFDASSKELTDDDKKTKELYKAVTGILNKLTPQKFDKLVSKIRTLNIDNESRLQGVIDLIFSKACDEPGFCQTYAQMCKVLQELQVGTADANEKKKCTFRYLIISKCQAEFETETAQTLDIDNRKEEIDTCTDPEKKKELQIQLEDDERKLRRKSVGNCRFIGELYKLGMLTPRIMSHCISYLVDKVYEESLECLCKLLQIIGKDLEANTTNVGASKPGTLDDVFKKMQTLTEKKNPNVPSRIRFMLLDVIDLRKTNWVPRRDENKPKTIAEINEEFNKQEQESRILSMIPPQMKKSDSFNRENRRAGQGGNGEWQTVPAHKNNQRNASTAYPFQKGKLETMLSNTSQQETFGSCGQFSSWGHGAASKLNPPQRGYNNTMYGMSDAQRSTQPISGMSYRGGHGSKVTPSPSMERNVHSFSSFRTDGHDNKLSRSGSLQPPSRDSSSSYRQAQLPPRLSQTSQPLPPPPVQVPPVVIPPVVIPPAVVPTTSQELPEILEDDALKKQSILLFEEYLSHRKASESVLCAKTIHVSQLGKMVSHIVDHVIEKKYDVKEACGKLFVGLCKSKTLSAENIVNGLQAICECSYDLKLDMPKLWDDVAILIGHLFEECIGFAYFKDFFANIPENESKLEFFVAIVNKLKESKGEKWVREKWMKSELNLKDFVPPDEISKFAKNHSEYPSWLESTTSMDNVINQCSTDELVTRLLDLLKTTDDAFKDVPLWISKNASYVDRPTIIYVLTLAIFRAVLKVGGNNEYKICDELPQQYRKLLEIFLDGHNEKEEIQCIYAAEKLSTELEHPAGLLLEMLKAIFTDNIVSCETFEKWKYEIQSDTSKLGSRGVILYSGGVKEFLSSLRTSDSES